MKVVTFDPGLSRAVAILDAETVYLIAGLPVHKIGVAGKKKPRAELDLHALHSLRVMDVCERIGGGSWALKG